MVAAIIVAMVGAMGWLWITTMVDAMVAAME